MSAPTKPPLPRRIELKKSAGCLCVDFDDGQVFTIAAQQLRQASPAADGTPTAPLPADIRITAVDAVGNYAIRPHFSDGHQSGIYDWGLLYKIGRAQ